MDRDVYSPLPKRRDHHPALRGWARSLRRFGFGGRRRGRRSARRAVADGRLRPPAGALVMNLTFSRTVERRRAAARSASCSGFLWRQARRPVPADGTIAVAAVAAAAARPVRAEPATAQARANRRRNRRPRRSLRKPTSVRVRRRSIRPDHPPGRRHAGGVRRDVRDGGAAARRLVPARREPRRLLVAFLVVGFAVVGNGAFDRLRRRRARADLILVARRAAFARLTGGRAAAAAACGVAAIRVGLAAVAALRPAG